MTTLMLSTTRIVPVPVQNRQPATAQESLAAAGVTIHHAVYLCASRYHQVRLLEDMEQEARLRVWIKLKDTPDASEGLIWTVAYRAAYYFLTRGKSVDRPVPLGKVHYIVDSLEAKIEGKDSPDTIDDALARRRRDELPNPTEDIAVARIMEQELLKYLSPQQLEVIPLLYKGFKEREIAQLVCRNESWVSLTVRAIREKATAVWGDTPLKPAPTPEEVRETRLLANRRKVRLYQVRHKDKINAKCRDWRALHREAVNARQRARRKEVKGQ